MHVCVIGGGAALAQPYIARCLGRGDSVTAVCREKIPELSHDSLRVVGGIDMACDDDAAYALVRVPPIDTLVTMTGAADNARLCDLRPDQWRAVLDATLTSVFYALKYGLPLVSGGGAAVVVGSVVGSGGGFGCANYAAAKAGLVGLVRAAANEHAARRVRVNLLELGYTEAGMGLRLPERVRERAMASVPLGRFGTADEAADAVDFLERAFTTGAVLTLAGGMR